MTSATGRHVMAVAVTDGIPIFELAVPCEVFGIDRSDFADPWYEFRLCAATDGPLRTTAGLRVEASHGIDGLDDADTVLVPACGRDIQLDPPPRLIDALRRAHARGARIISICSGVYALAAAGLLDGRQATAHWMHAVDFAYRFPNVKLDPSVLYVDEGEILTSAGTGAAIDLCLHVVRLDHGAAVANEVARRMVVPPHRDGGQAQFAALATKGGGAKFRFGGGSRASATGLSGVLEWARNRLDKPLTVADLAREAHMSTRTFARRFADEVGLTPLQWLVRQRVRLAQELLETTDEPVERIARLTGFGTAANLRQHFGRVTSISPQSYRQVFRRGVGTLS
jgi:transcriptional regulator GlxA family with amidase domain